MPAKKVFDAALIQLIQDEMAHNPYEHLGQIWAVLTTGLERLAVHLGVSTDFLSPLSPRRGAVGFHGRRVDHQLQRRASGPRQRLEHAHPDALVRPAHITVVKRLAGSLIGGRIDRPFCGLGFCFCFRVVLCLAFFVVFFCWLLWWFLWRTAADR